MNSTAKLVTKFLFCSLCALAALGGASERLLATQSVPLMWNPSTDTNVAGYRIYYGSASQFYTNSVTVGDVTNTVIGGLMDGCTYFFAAKSYDSAGNESEFSNEASISSSSVAATGEICLNASPFDNTNGQYTFSLASGAPAGVSVNPTNGMLDWTPGLGNAATTNFIQVIVTDSQTRNSSAIETMVVTVTPLPGDYFYLGLGATAVQAGQFASLPVSISSSAGATNLLFVFPWPGNILTNVSLTLNDTNISGRAYVCDGILFIEISNGSIASGSTALGQLQFQASAGQDSAVVSVPVIGSQCVKADSTIYDNVICPGFTVTVIGVHPLLAPASAGANNLLTVYGNPQSVYQVQSATNLTAPVAWQPALTYTQTNLVQSVVLPNSGPAIFYRLAQQ
jgi:hypothetical protein